MHHADGQRLAVPTPQLYLLLDPFRRRLLGAGNPIGRRARRRRDDAWYGVFLFLMAYFIAALVNASFDVYLEGPMGGIWFWCLYGIGLAAIVAYRRLGQQEVAAHA